MTSCFGDGKTFHGEQHDSGWSKQRPTILPGLSHPTFATILWTFPCLVLVLNEDSANKGFSNASTPQRQDEINKHQPETSCAWLFQTISAEGIYIC